jgi:hypothetical protein
MSSIRTHLPFAAGTVCRLFCRLIKYLFQQPQSSPKPTLTAESLSSMGRDHPPGQLTFLGGCFGWNGFKSDVVLAVVVRFVSPARTRDHPHSSAALSTAE